MNRLLLLCDVMQLLGFGARFQCSVPLQSQLIFSDIVL